MTTKTLLAVLGPAIVFAVVVQLLDLTSMLSPFGLSFAVALFSSVATLFLISASSGIASTTSTGGNSNGSKTASASTASSRNNGRKELGNVKWFNSSKGFGFITRDNGEEIFVHFRSIVNGKSLRDGQRVEFAVTTGTKGLQAEEVVALK